MTWKTKIRAWRTISVPFDDRTLIGSYASRDGVVEVRSLKGERKATPIGGSTPESLARCMLMELAQEGRA
jgi:hypothetical protein